MKLTAQEFLDQPRKAITLMGMSGAGKTYLGCKLAEWGWASYSCDYLIGTQYLSEYLKDTISADNIGSLSAFVGQIGNEQRGGLPRAEFRRRQKLYYDAEVGSIRDVGDALARANEAGKNFVVDSSGSLCEIEDEAVLAALGRQTLFVYLKISQDDHAELVERATKSPKPLYFPEAFFNERLAFYMSQFDMKDDAEIDPIEFLRWVFPFLFTARLPKYQALAERYGVTVRVADLKNIRSEQEFLDVVAKALGEQAG